MGDVIAFLVLCILFAVIFRENRRQDRERSRAALAREVDSYFDEE